MSPVFIWLLPDSLPPLHQENTKHRDMAYRHAAFNLTNACLLLLTFHIKFIPALIMVQFNSINITRIKILFIEQGLFNWNIFIVFGQTSIIDKRWGNYLEPITKACMPQRRSESFSTPPWRKENWQPPLYIIYVYNNHAVDTACACAVRWSQCSCHSLQLLATLMGKPHCPLLVALQQCCKVTSSFVVSVSFALLFFILFDFFKKKEHTGYVSIYILLQIWRGDTKRMDELNLDDGSLENDKSSGAVVSQEQSVNEGVLRQKAARQDLQHSPPWSHYQHVFDLHRPNHSFRLTGDFPVAWSCFGLVRWASPTTQDKCEKKRILNMSGIIY